MHGRDSLRDLILAGADVSLVKSNAIGECRRARNGDGNGGGRGNGRVSEFDYGNGDGDGWGEGPGQGGRPWDFSFYSGSGDGDGSGNCTLLSCSWEGEDLPGVDEELLGEEYRWALSSHSSS